MDKLRISEIAGWCRGSVSGKNCKVIASAVSTDTRTLVPGSIFVALKGKNFDGHDFVGTAMKNGAVAAIVERRLQGDFPQILVQNTQKALGDIAKNYRMKFSCPIIGISGSDGKTTAKEMTAQILSCKYKVCKNEGNFNNEIGLPLSIFSLNRETDIGVFELGMNAAGQLKYLGGILQPDIAFITNVGYAHVGFFQNRNALARAKGELLECVSRNGFALVNQDTGFLGLFRRISNVPIGTFGFSKYAGFRAKYLESGIDFFTMLVINWNEEFRLNFWNGGFAYPALGALCIGEHFGIPRHVMKRQLAEFEPIEGRGRIISIRGIKLFDESYNANPGSIRNALKYFCVQSASRRIVVIGAMAELGRFSLRYHASIGRLLAKCPVDMVFTVGDDAYVIARILKSRAKHFEDVQTLASHLIRYLRRGDAVLVKGSRVNHLEIVVNALKSSA